MVRRSGRRTAIRVLASAAAATLVAVGLTAVARADTEPTGTSTTTTAVRTPAVTPTTTAPATPSAGPSAPSTSPTSAPATSSPSTPAPPAPTPSRTSATPDRRASTATVAPQAVAADPIVDRWLALGGASSFLGNAVGERKSVSGGQRQDFQGGTIWWSAGTGAWETHGGVAQRYLQIGATTSWLGFPTSGEVPVLGGVRQHFAGGYMWWISAAGAWETHGGINVRFLQIYNVASWLGFPTSGEVAVAGGVRQTFQGGSIWWSSPSGAWETHGAIGDEYLRGSGASGWYGFPVSPEYSYYGGRRQDYQHGSILWNVQPVLDATYAPVTKADVWASWRPGCPVGPESLTLIRMNYWGFDNAVHRASSSSARTSPGASPTSSPRRSAIASRSGRCGGWTGSTAATRTPWPRTTPPASTAAR